MCVCVCAHVHACVTMDANLTVTPLYYSDVLLLLVMDNGYTANFAKCDTIP